MQETTLIGFPKVWYKMLSRPLCMLSRPLLNQWVRHIILNGMYGKYLPALGLGIQWSHVVIFTENTSGLTALGIFTKTTRRDHRISQPRAGMCWETPAVTGML